MADRPATLELPDDLRAFFWDYDPVRLSGELSRHTIVLRLLEKGGMQAVRWLRQQLTDEEIRQFIVRRRGRGISPRRLRFWGLLLDIPRHDVDEWIESARQNPWQTRTAR
jgi:hypothetical protein